MPIRQAKIYYDGSHYIAIPPENFTGGKPKRLSPLPPVQAEVKAKFETVYAESQRLPKSERKPYITEQMQDSFTNENERTAFIENNLERKKNNFIKRRVTLWRKVRLQQWTHFVTFTFNGSKHTEETFEKSLRNTLKHLVYRKGWKYIGVFERSPKKERLHFHGIFYIPENAMSGKLKIVIDYDTRKHRKQTTLQNTHFLETLGRNDFKEICCRDVERSVRYLLKYIEKSGEKLIYGGKLPTYFVSDILDEDIICPTGIDGKKVILADNFTCIDSDGVVHGKVSPEVIDKMPKSN